MQRYIKENCQSSLKVRTSFKTWSAVENFYQVITYVFVVEVYNKIHDQQSEIYKIKAALITAIQQMISEFCEIADIDSFCCMRKEKSLIFYQALDSEFYHLKKQVKIMKLTDINLKKMRSLINDHMIQIIKLSASATTTISSSANLVNKNKQKSDDEQSENQSEWLNKRQQNNHEKKIKKFKNSENVMKKCNYYDKTDYLEKNC